MISSMTYSFIREELIESSSTRYSSPELRHYSDNSGSQGLGRDRGISHSVLRTTYGIGYTLSLV